VSVCTGVWGEDSGSFVLSVSFQIGKIDTTYGWKGLRSTVDLCSMSESVWKKPNKIIATNSLHLILLSPLYGIGLRGTIPEHPIEHRSNSPSIRQGIYHFNGI
jgi:hypothetical protein